MKYDIETSVAAEEHLDDLSAFDRKRILEAIEEQLIVLILKKAETMPSLLPLRSWLTTAPNDG
jgi:hypothetical protein